MKEICTRCGTVRPSYIADPTCTKGGYHTWEFLTLAPKEKPRFTDEELFVAYLPAVIGWLAIRDPGQTSWNFFDDAVAKTIHLVCLHRSQTFPIDPDPKEPDTPDDTP